MKTIGILVFEQVEELDFIGPLEVFGMASQFGADCQTVLIASQLLGPLRCRHGLRVLPECTLEEAPALDVLIIPGGIGARTQARADPEILEFVRQQPGLVASVCTGALILAAAGVLDDLAATTHHSALDLLREHAAVNVRSEVRFVLHERVGTSAGVTAGIDLALAIVMREWGDVVADAVAANLEWESTTWKQVQSDKRLVQWTFTMRSRCNSWLPASSLSGLSDQRHARCLR
jgi:transcriptional regulator GlxA family with amidase domain